MLMTFTLIVTAINLAISITGAQRYMTVLLPETVVFWINIGSAVFAGVWLGVMYWLDAWLFAAIMAGLGFVGVIHHYKLVMSHARQQTLLNNLFGQQQ